MKKTKEEAEQTRIAILRASYEIINEKGFERMTRTDIAEHVGMTRGAVNWHFKTKDEIYLAVLEDILDRMEKSRKKYQESKALSPEEKLIKLYMLPIKQVKLFHFVNSIPHYLLAESAFSELEKRIFNNRLHFLEYLEALLSEIENGGSIIENKKSVAQALYLIYEGLHARSSWNLTMVDFTENEIWAMLKKVIY